MEIKDMTMEDIETRSAEIEELIKGGEYDAESLDAEIDALALRKAEIRKEAEERKAQIEEILSSSTTVMDFKEEKEMENKEIRNSKEYIDAYAEYLRTGDDRQCRTLMTENGGGNVAVPDFVLDEVKRAWEDDEILGKVKKWFLKGNVKAPFEAYADGAHVQTEGAQVNEQNLIMGFVELKPEMIKKYVKVTAQAEKLDDSGAYIRFIYEELAHYIAAKAVEELLDKIDACGTLSTTTMVGVPAISAAPGLGTVAQAMAELSDQAKDPMIIMNRKSWGAMKAAAYTNGFAADPFEGLPVAFNNSLPAYADATTNDTWAIVGDMAYGAVANFPDGEGIEILRDPYTLADYNIIRYRGDEFVAIAPVAPNAFVKIQK